MTTPSLHKRENIGALTKAGTVYQALVTLHVGQRVPEQCYILDYWDGIIPPWQVYQREQDNTLVILVLIDQDVCRQATLFEPQQWVARQVLASPSKILATPPYMIGLDGVGPRPMLCDLIQQARAVARNHDINPQEVQHA